MSEIFVEIANSPPRLVSLNELQKILSNLPKDSFWFRIDGRLCSDGFSRGFVAKHVEIMFRLRGGKGGFGSNLRATKSKVKVDNGSCRDLDGNRIRSNREREQLSNWNGATMTETEIQRSFRAINQGTYVDKRPCKFGLQCTRKESCGFSHPDDLQRERAAAEKRKRQEQASLKKKVAKVMKSVETSASSIADAIGQGLAVSLESKSSGLDAASDSKILEEEKWRHQEHLKADITKNVSATSSEPVVDFHPISLDSVESASDLECFGLDHLKSELTRLGLKCGGTLKERCERLFLLKTMSFDEISSKNKAKKK